MRGIALLAPLVALAFAGCFEPDLLWPPPGMDPPPHCGLSLHALTWREPGLFAALPNVEGPASFEEQVPPDLPMRAHVTVLGEQALLWRVVEWEREEPYAEPPVPYEERARFEVEAMPGATANLTILKPEPVQRDALLGRLERFAARVAHDDGEARAARWLEWAEANETDAGFSVSVRPDGRGGEIPFRTMHAWIHAPFRLDELWNETRPAEEHPYGIGVATYGGSGFGFEFRFPLRTLREGNETLTVDSRDEAQFEAPFRTGDVSTATQRANATLARWNVPPPTYERLQPLGTIC